MKTIFHSFLYCCLLATVAHCVELEVKPELRKRPSIWQASRLRRSLDSVTVEKTAESEHIIRSEDIRDTLLPHPSTFINVRTKRSINSADQLRRQDCSLGTCSLHDLAHRLHQLNNKLKIGSAPVDKISPQGYVRTKRSINSADQLRRQDCSLGTCSLHDLAHRLHQLNNKLKIGSAPVDKISPQGYGRTKRSINSANQVRRQGCSLGTCSLHDLAHRLHQLNNKLKIGSAPVDKISPQGYGRRRRSLPERRVTLRLGKGRLRPVWSTDESEVLKLEALLRRTWTGLCKGSALLSKQCIRSILKFLKMPPTLAKYIPA